jgi:preprotein translocase subunit SecD
VLGGSLVPSASIASADVKYDTITKSWVTAVHFKNDAFRKNVVTPLAGKQVAAVLAGFVQSTITVNAAAAGRAVDIEGGFTRAGAAEVAAAIMGVAPASVKVDATGS